jgi:hypothetical protein
MKKNRKRSLLKGLAKKNKGKKLNEFKKTVSKKVGDPFWTIEDGITNSILNKFLNCRHRFYLSQVQGWKPKSFPFHLEFGNVFHLMAEAQDLGYDDRQFELIADNYVQKKIEKVSAGAEQIRELTILAKVATYTFIEYKKYWDDEVSLIIRGKEYYERDFKWFDKEHAFDFEYTMLHGRKVRLRGKIDGIFDLGGLETTTVFETKTKGRIDELAIEKGLHKDMQTGLYSLATKHLRRNTTPRGVLYNVVRRTQLKPRVKEKAVDFANRVKKDIQKRPDFYFMRWNRTLSDSELEYFRLNMLEPTLYQITTWWDSVKKNLDNPFMTTCDFCQ